MKLTKAPNCPCVLHTPSLFKYDTIGYISYFKYSTACSFVIFYPFLTPLVCPYPIVQTPAGHLYAVSTKPSKLHIPLIVVLSILNIISTNYFVSSGAINPRAFKLAINVLNLVITSSTDVASWILSNCSVSLFKSLSVTLAEPNLKI